MARSSAYKMCISTASNVSFKRGRADMTSRCNVLDKIGCLNTLGMSKKTKKCNASRRAIGRLCEVKKRRTKWM